MYYFDLKKADVVNGKGVRVSLFVSGCTHNCKGCFAKREQNFKYGKEFTEETVKEIINELRRPFIAGLSILGGDPLADKNFNCVLELCKKVKKEFPEKTIYVWTGYILSDIINSYKGEILKYIDGIVDGKFEIDKYSDILIGRGSSNQKTYIKDEHGHWVEIGDIYMEDMNED